MIGKHVPIPERMAGLERDHRGYPVPANVMRDGKGLPVFTVNNINWVIENQITAAVPKCGICGGDLEIGDMYFLGGPVSALHPHGAFADGPLHLECGEYAVQVCPWLALPSGRYKHAIGEKAIKNPTDDAAFLVDITQYADKPPCYVLARCVSFGMTLAENRFLPVSGPAPQFVSDDPQFSHFIQHRWLSIGVWLDGVHVDDEQEQMDLIREGMKVLEQEPQAPRRV